ncbi:MAG: ribulose-phosphate 3-epimerase [Thermoplasmataceae archaeon]
MKISPSIISSRLEVLGEEIEKCDTAGADSYHLDVMDGHFVPNLTMGPDLISAVRRKTKKQLESHLMIDRPDRYYRSFIDSGSDILLVHAECLVNFKKLRNDIADSGAEFGIVINPETPLSEALPYLPESKILLLMSVHPGFSGQKFIAGTVEKIKEARSYIDRNGLDTEIEVDGGINEITGKLCADAGADILVSASYIFSGNIHERIGILKDLKRD